MRSMEMKKRVKSFIMAILMVFTILPTNFTSVGAESEFTICLDVHDLDESVFDSKMFNINVTNEDGTKVDGLTHDIGKNLEKNIENQILFF